MFRSATFQLTAWYLALIMGLSLAFSVVLYNSSSGSLADSFDRQRAVIRQQYLNAFGYPSPYSLNQLRDNEVGAAEQRLVANLTLANVAVLVIGGAASFLMARRTLRPIEQAMESQMRFTADASHELRTPLTAMQTEIEVALRDKDLSVKDSRDLLASNLEEVRKLQDLSNGLLALAHSDKAHFVPQPISSAKVLATALSRVAIAAKQKKISIDNQAGQLTMLGDADALAQLFVILLDNAIKYSPAGSTVTVSSTAKAGQARISVADHGYGIKPDDLPHIFDRLYRADSSRSKEKVSGYGLGLSIAKKIVELHGGAIDVSSKTGSGSAFTVRVPLAAKTSK